MPENMPGEGIGHFFGAMRIDAFRPASDFKTNMDNWIQRFRSAKTVAGQERVIIPGEPEIEMQNARMKNGIYLMQPVVDNLQVLGDTFGVKL
jgi:LDH2 family malate/lactate/ureidoglycolate dehydrogenase